MMAVTAGYDRRTVIPIVDLLISNGKRINIEPVSVEKIGKLIGIFEIQCLGKTKFSPNLKQAIDDLQGGEALSWVFVSCHVAQGVGFPTLTYDYDSPALVVRIISCERRKRFLHQIDRKKLKILRNNSSVRVHSSSRRRTKYE